MFNDNDSYLVVAIKFILTVLTLSAFVFLIVVSLSIVNCNNMKEITGMETKYYFVSGCYIKAKAGWIPAGRCARLSINNNTENT